jgi:large subunit ribosomal protein L4
VAIRQPARSAAIKKAPASSSRIKASSSGVKARYFDALGKSGEEVDLPAAIFDAPVNPAVMHAVVRAQLAAARSGTHSTKTRAEVRGGGARPWRQKGTGRARHGSIREPQWVGGGVAHGPKPRDYSMRVSKKEKALALTSALTVRARDGKVMVVDLPEFEQPETRRAASLLERWGVTGRVLLVMGDDPEVASDVWKSFRNLPQVVSVRHPTASMVLAADTVVLARDALGELSTAHDVARAQRASVAVEPAAKAPRAAPENEDTK